MMSQLRGQVIRVRLPVRWVSAGSSAFTEQEFVAAIKTYNASGRKPDFFPVNRNRELEILLKATVKNWSGGSHKKVNLPVLSGSNGTGKTFLLQFLNSFLSKTLEQEVLPVPLEMSVELGAAAPRPTATILDATEEVLKNSVGEDCLKAMRKLKDVRPFLVPLSHLQPKCVNLDQAIMVGVAANILGKAAHVDFAKNLKKIGVKSLDDLCNLLIAETGGAVIILDDFVDLIGRGSHGKMLTGTKCKATSREVFDALSMVVEQLLRKPGVVMAITGRSPSITYDTLQTGRAAPIEITSIVLDALSPVDVANIYYNSTAGYDGRLVSLRFALGLHTDKDVLAAARILYFYSGGHPRVLMYVIEALIEEKVLLNRDDKKTVGDVLHHDFMMKLYTTYLKGKTTLLPRWSRVIPTWDAAKTMHELLVVLQSKGTPLNADMMVDVGAANGEEVMLLELLSVMGVPFQTLSVDAKRFSEKISVFPHPWVLEAIASKAHRLK